ncbi:Centrosomal protein of 76 kDa-like [Homarus americanus]|uniref:Centrosomal protein of 76 kDa-like n=1 Tax=Homarus americanus TaxID=6706 RepID=A0A8J5JX36_HOMAM|nr:Centrosomal protein of 76 kDa-like [Homarus americanus]
MAENNSGNQTVEDALRSEMERENLQSAVDRLIHEIVSEEAGHSSTVDPESVVARLLDSSTVQSLVQRVLASSRSEQTSCHLSGSIPSHIQEQLVPGHRYLYLKLCGGRAFVDHLGVNATPLAADSQAFIKIHLAFQSQRFEAHGVPCVCEPKIYEGFLFDLQLLKPGLPNMLDNAELLTMDVPITIAVVRQQGATTTLLSVHTLEWRSLLAQPSATSKFVCQLMGIAVSEYLEGTKNRAGEKRRLFISYAREWWREYTEASASHSSRPVRIFAMDECGKNRFVCEFVRRLEAGRALRSPEEATRWISVMPSIPVHELPAGSSKPWYTLPTALMSHSLNNESKCSLLCSILLGFGLDSWVCVGTRRSGSPHVWVMTRGPYSAYTFWEITTGSRYLHRVGQKAAHDYGTIGSVFNNDSFYATCQATDKIEYCNFSLEDSNAWKKMSFSATSSMTEKMPCLMPLIPPTNDGIKKSTDIELQLQVLIIEHRSDCGLSSHFDKHLSYVLSPALWSYEREIVEGGNGTENKGMELFSAALMHTLPEGHTFKAFPFYFVHRSPRRAFNTILNSSIGREIVECRGDKVTLAVRSLTVCYPEYVYVTWLMVACSFRPVG